MSQYPRTKLKGLPSDVEADETLLEDHFENNEADKGKPFWFVKHGPIVTKAAEYDSEGEVISPAEYGDEITATIIFPPGHNFDLATLSTIDNS